MKKTIKNLFTLVIGVLLAYIIIQCQNAQRTYKVDPEPFGIGEHKQVYYDYYNYNKNK